jgi:hypothetical protein
MTRRLEYRVGSGSEFGVCELRPSSYGEITRHIVESFWKDNACGEE